MTLWLPSLGKKIGKSVLQVPIAQAGVCDSQARRTSILTPSLVWLLPLTHFEGVRQPYLEGRTNLEKGRTTGQRGLEKPCMSAWSVSGFLPEALESGPHLNSRTSQSSGRHHT